MPEVAILSLRRKVTLMMSGALLLMLLLNAGALLPVRRSFDALEREGAKQNSDRVVKAISTEVEHMARSVIDWSTWDETYQFVAGEHPTYEDENLYFGS